MNRYFTSLISGLCVLLLLPAAASARQVSPSTPSELEAAIQKRDQMRSESLFLNYPLRDVGPVTMSARVTDIAVHPENSRIFYTGFASGGVYKTENSGNTMEPVFDHVGVLGIGDIAISQSNPDILWVGTGENNSSRSSYAGAGMYKSEDAGETWTYSGLRGTQHIGRVIIHPENPDIVWVASIGALYSKNEDRGLYKTTDGGESWEKTLFISDSTGVIDLVIHPENPDILWATSWERSRAAWNFKEGGTESAIYKSTDGGESWTKSVKGFPQGEFVGRIGLDISRSNPDIIYALLDNQYETREKRDSEDEGLTQASFTDMSEKEFLNLNDSDINDYLRSNGFPRGYTARQAKEDIRNDKYEPKALADFLGDANAALFNTSIEGAEIYRSENGGESWEKINDYQLGNLYNTYGYYFGEIRVDPSNPDVLYILGVPLLKSTDGGNTWKRVADNQPVHADQQAMWIDPMDSQHILLGNDGGLYESHDGAENFIHHNVASVGQFYTVNVDMEEPYNIYGGLQDNGTWVGSSTSSPNRYRPWTRLFGGDGMHVAADPRNADIVYVGFQYGNYFRLNREKGSSERITPRHNVGEDRYRYNWNTPIQLSHHNPDIVYFGSQRLNRSFDQGDNWTAISPDLTHDLPNGDVPYSTLTTIAESPLNFNVIWTGSDDGKVQISRDAGSSWTDVTGNLPARRWISEVHASVHDEATAFVSLNGYRYDEFKTYLYKTTDYGQTWTSVKGDLPDEVANIIVQDPVKPEILYAGLDHGTYISFNDGENWEYLSPLANVASYDMVIHPRELDLVIATHGRSIHVMDIEPLHAVSDRLNEAITVMKPEDIRYSGRWGYQSAEYSEPYMPSVDILYYLGNDRNGQNVTIRVLNKDEEEVYTASATGVHGFNTYSWDLVTGENEEGKPEFLGKGEYIIEFETANQKESVAFNVK